VVPDPCTPDGDQSVGGEESVGMFRREAGGPNLPAVGRYLPNHFLGRRYRALILVVEREGIDDLLVFGHLFYGTRYS